MKSSVVAPIMPYPTAAGEVRRHGEAVQSPKLTANPLLSPSYALHAQMRTLPKGNGSSKYLSPNCGVEIDTRYPELAPHPATQSEQRSRPEHHIPQVYSYFSDDSSDESTDEDEDDTLKVAKGSRRSSGTITPVSRFSSLGKKMGMEVVTNLVKRQSRRSFGKMGSSGHLVGGSQDEGEDVDEPEEWVRLKIEDVMIADAQLIERKGKVGVYSFRYQRFGIAE